MINKMKCMFSRLAAQFLKPTLALLAVCIVGGALAADPAWLVWDAGGGDDSYFTTAANWSNDAAPSADTNASREFASASMGKAVTFNTADESVGAIYVRNLWNKTDALTPVVFEAKDSNQSYGFVAARAFSAADMANSQSAFTIKSGTYKANEWSLWAYGANSSLDAKIKGGTVSLNGGIGIAEGVGGNVTSRVDVCGGTLAIEGGDMLIGLNSDADSLAEISVSNGGVISCGENVEKWIALGHGGSYAGTVNFNIDAGGTLKAWRIEKRSSTTTTKAKINFNGGTLAALGEQEIIGAGIDVVIGANGGTIDVGANAVTIAATVTGSGSIIKKGSGTLEFTGDMSGFTGQIIVAEGGSVTVSATGTSATAGVGTAQNGLVFNSTAFAWTGAANDGGKWSTPGNWAIAGVAQTVNYPNSADAVVSFVGATSVTVDASSQIKTAVIVASVTLSGSATLTAEAFEGNGLLILSNSTISSRSDENACVDFNCDIYIDGSTENKWICANTTSGTAGNYFKVNAAMTGSGKITCEERARQQGAIFKGDISAFAGTYEVTRIGSVANYARRDYTQFYSDTATSSDATWNIVGSGEAEDILKEGSKTYYFGALNGTFDNKSSGYLNNALVVIGGKNEYCSFGGRFSRGDKDNGHRYQNHLKKVGTGVLETTASNIGNIEIEDGVLALNSTSSLPAQYDHVSYAIKFTGGTLRTGTDTTTEEPIDPSAYIKGSSAAIVFDDQGVPSTWESAIANSNTGGFTKKGAGTLTLKYAPQYTGTTTVKAGALVLPDDTTSLDGLVLDGGSITANGVTSYGDVTINSGTLNVAKSATIGTLTIADGATLALTGDGGATITVTSFADGDTTKSRITTPTGTTLSWEGNVGTLVRSAYTYTWTDATGDHAWENRGNWTIPVNEVATVPAYLPSDIDTVYFGATCEVVLSADQPAKSLMVASGAKLTLTGGGSYGVTSLQEVPTGGQLVLNGSGLSSYSIPVATSHIDWALNIEVADKTSNWIVPTAAASDNGAGCYVNYGGNLTGTGAILLGKVGDTTRSSVVLSGDNTQFYGTATIQAGTSSRGRITFQSESASSEHARWIVVGHDKNAVAGCGAMNVTGKTMMFGSYEGTCYVFACSSYTGNTLEIGALNTSFTCSLSATANSAANRANNNATLRKVGTGVMTFGNTAGNPCFNAYEMNGGVLLFANADILKSETGSNSYINPSYKFTGGTVSFDPEVCIDTNGDLLDISPYIAGSTSAISVSNDTALVWASQLKSTNTGGLTKKGAGTLTLSQPPAYTGTTTVEAGALYVIVDSENPFNPMLDSSTAEVTTDKDGYRKFVPASVAISAPTVVWGDDFAKVTVSADVTSTYGEGGLTYNLKIGGNVVDGAVGTVNNGVVTFSDVNVSGLNLSRYEDVSVEVTASAGGSQAATSGPKNVMFADTKDWVKENYETTTTAAAGGAWQTAVTYDSETHKAAVVDNRFSATNCTTGDVVTVTIDDVVYTGLSDLTSADTDAQGAVAVGGTEDAPKFMLLTKKNNTVGWYEAAGVTPVLETGVYDIVMTFNYNSNTYTVTVNGTPLTVDNIAAVPLAKAQTSVKDIDFLGAGSLAAITGVQYEGKMAIDQNGRKYATVAEALEANASVKGAVIKLLHDSATTSAEGWNFDSDTKTFVKKVIGLIFLAF